MRDGIPIVEINLTVPGTKELIAHPVRSDSKVIIGAGTVLDCDTARECMDAGAGFLTSPSFNPEIVEFTAKHNIAVLPCAMTPTEVVAAWSADADFIKVFPCGQIGGEKYFNALNASLPQIPLIEAGGVDQQTAAGYILSGATAIGVGTELIPSEAIARRQAKRIQELARRYTRIVKEAREHIEAWKQSLIVKKFSEDEECEK